MNAGNLKKIFNALPDDADTTMEIYRHNKLDSQTCIDKVEIDGDMSNVTFKGIFTDKE